VHLGRQLVLKTDRDVAILRAKPWFKPLEDNPAATALLTAGVALTFALHTSER